MSTKELIAGCISFFTGDKNLKELFATSDGQYFFEKNRADLYKQSKRNPKSLKDTITVVPITREQALAEVNEKVDAPVKSEFLQQSVTDIKKALKTADDAEALKVFLAEEESNAPRSTAVHAIKARIEELENPAE